MIYKNIEIHNVAELIPGKAEESTAWIRVPAAVYETLEASGGKSQAVNSTGVELRFVMKSDSVKIRMRVPQGTVVYHIYRGSIQGGWEDHEVPACPEGEPFEVVVKRSPNLEVLRRIADENHQPFSPEVVRVIFDRGTLELLDVIGDVEPPKKEQLPAKTLLCYGSSITHGSNSIDASHSWVSMAAHNLKMDVRNLGLAGSCCMEPVIVDYIAGEGEKGNWDMAVLELGINVLGWEEEKIIERVTNVLVQVAGRNPEKPVFVISPFYCNDDYFEWGRAAKWRRLIEEIIQERKDANVTYINGLDLLGDMSLISADEVHPNIYGVQRIAERLTERIREKG